MLEQRPQVETDDRLVLGDQDPHTASLGGRAEGETGESLRRTLAFLADAGLLDRNPGYDHPLRPEYILTARGRPPARRACGLLAALTGYEEVGLKKWSLPVLAELDSPRRFSELHASLPVASPRALTLALKDLQSVGLVRRTVTDEYPPAVRYEASAAAAELVRAARGLA